MKKTSLLLIACLAFVLNSCGQAVTPLPLTATPVKSVTPTATLTIPTTTPIPTTPTPAPPTATSPSPTDMPVPTPAATTASLPATSTVCAIGCDFTNIQTAIDNASTLNGSVIEITDPIHTEAGIVINKDITIQGQEGSSTIVQARETPSHAPERVFLIKKGASVILKRLTIRHGKPSIRDGHGGGINNEGNLTLENCTVTLNVADGGGGIRTNGELLLINTTVSSNIAEGTAPPPGIACGGGGGIKCDAGPLTLINSTVSNNQAGIRGRGWGGGIHVACNCAATLINSTISGNKSAADSGGIRDRGKLYLVNSTISNNTAAGIGGGVYVLGKLDYVNTIIYGNIGKKGNCVIGSQQGFTFQGEGSISTNHNNLVGSGNCNPDYTGDPLLGPLADNSGATLTHALLEGSPAIDVIPANSCPLPIDQRSMPRPVTLTLPDTPCDIGAFEVQAATSP